MTAAAKTIVALASAAGPAGVAVIRASGPSAFAGLAALTHGQNMPPARFAALMRLTSPADGQLLDEALVLRFVAPNSFTGEDCVEYQTHGGRAVVDAVIGALLALPDHRLAQPGEYTRRAFENGRIDLTGAEAIADLVHAETEAQRVQALDQLGGGLKRLYEDWADRLLRILAHTEADLDFADEGDIPDGLGDAARAKLEGLMADISAHLNDNRRGERLRDGVKIAVVGPPNAGKSTLVNALARREVAIVSPHAGTTRDVVEVHLNLSGYPVIIADTAGLRPDQLGDDVQGAIEGEGIKRAKAWAQDADIVVVAYDGQQWPVRDPHADALLDARALPIITKAEQLAAGAQIPYLAISVEQNTHMDAFLSALGERVKSVLGAGNGPALTRTRHRAALGECLSHLTRAGTAPAAELAAEDLRLAVRALGTITGTIHAEDVLDVIFRDFCIGK